MTIEERLIKEMEFVLEAQSIMMTLITLERRRMATGVPPTKQILLSEYRKFKRLKKEAEEITEAILFTPQKEATLAAFELFSDVVPKFRGMK